jgi:predicted RNA-binding protein with PIN domain
MPALPDDVAASLVRGIGTYLRELPARELPADLRRYRSFRPQALTPHRDKLLAALENDATRARIKHWLKTNKSRLAKDDARVLTVATAREEGWEEELKGASKPRVERQKPATEPGSKVEAEREKTRKAKDELKKARDELRNVEQRSAARISDLEATIADLTGRLAKAEKDAATAQAEAGRAIERAERTQRKARKDSEKAAHDRDAARKEAKDLRRELAATRAAAPKSDPTPRAATKKSASKPKKRAPLMVPKGRLADDPATLKKWLGRDDVRLLIDGYNVARAEGGFEGQLLEGQRERLIDAVFKLAKMTDTETIVVFDAQMVPGRRSRKTRKRPVVIEWSNQDQIADDYIVARLEELPQEPVILVTNDKELQERGRELAATIATSQQLLALIR